MKTSKWVSASLAIVLSFGLLAGCGGSKDASAPTNSGTASGASDVKPITLKLSHQWPAATATTGDFRGQLAERFKEEVEKRTNGAVKIEIYPSSSLVKEKEQYDAMLQGALDMSVYPLDYAGGKVPQFGITLMPAMIKNHEIADKWKDAAIGKKIDEIANKNGIRILTWVWNAGAIGATSDPIVYPSDIKPGMKIRAAGKRVEAMLASAGAGITSMSSAEIYSAIQTKVLDAAITSASSFGSYKLYEQVKSYTTSEKNTFWFMFEPLIISNSTWDKLTPEQQKIFTEVGNELQDFANKASAADDAATTKLFKENGVKVIDMPDDAFAQWEQLSKPIWEEFAQKVDGGKELVELAQQVK